MSRASSVGCWVLVASRSRCTAAPILLVHSSRFIVVITIIDSLFDVFCSLIEHHEEEQISLHRAATPFRYQLRALGSSHIPLTRF